MKPNSFIRLIPVSFALYTIAVGNHLPSRRQGAHIQVTADQGDVRVVLKDIFKKLHASYEVSRKVKGIVTLSTDYTSFNGFLELMSRDKAETYYLKAGIYHLTKRPAAEAASAS